MMKICKVLLTIAGLSLFLSCSKEEPNCEDISYNQEFVFKNEDVFCLPDGIELTISNIEDARCPCDVICVWEGEFLFELSITDGQNTEVYILHEKIENEDLQLFNLQFDNILFLSDEDSCDNPVPLDEMEFSMSIINS